MAGAQVLELDEANDGRMGSSSARVGAWSHIESVGGGSEMKAGA
jgi:hypothetical protein